MKTMITLTIALAALLGLSSCASTSKSQQLDQNIKAQAPADSPEMIANRAAMAFSNAENLTPEQKVKLAGIYSEVYTQSMKIRREMGQAKSLLFMTLAKVDYNSKEITDLKKKIVVLDQSRLDLMFKALDDVQKIVGRGADREKIYKHLQENEMPYRMMKDYYQY